MSAANVRNIQVLADMKAALARFKSDAQAQLLATQQEIQRTQEWLAERERHWQREVRRCEEIMRQAQSALMRCQASGFRDQQGRYHPPNCSTEERAVTQARSQLENVRRELQTVQHWTHAVTQAAAEFQREAQRLTNMLNSDVVKASALLENKISVLQSYIVMGAPPAHSSSISETFSSPVPSTPSLTWSQQRALWERVNAGKSITLEELKQLQQLPADLQTETRAEDESWIQQIIESERYREAMHDSQEADDLRDALLATMKAINYWHSKS